MQLTLLIVVIRKLIQFNEHVRKLIQFNEHVRLFKIHHGTEPNLPWHAIILPAISIASDLVEIPVPDQACWKHGIDFQMRLLR